MRRVPIAAVRRRGSLVPAVAVALAVVGAFMAVVLDRLWIDAARMELLTAAEAAAHLAARCESADVHRRAAFRAGDHERRLSIEELGRGHWIPIS